MLCLFSFLQAQSLCCNKLGILQLSKLSPADLGFQSHELILSLNSHSFIPPSALAGSIKGQLCQTYSNKPFAGSFICLILTRVLTLGTSCRQHGPPNARMPLLKCNAAAIDTDPALLGTAKCFHKPGQDQWCQLRGQERSHLCWYPLRSAATGEPEVGAKRASFSFIIIIQKAFDGSCAVP
jgi:hypothetical protein